MILSNSEPDNEELVFVTIWGGVLGLLVPYMSGIVRLRFPTHATKEEREGIINDWIRYYKLRYL